MGSRRKGREAAVRILYSMDVAGLRAEQARRRYWAELAGDEDGREFADSLVNGYADEQDAIDAQIGSASHHWRLERMPIVDRSVLRAAATELRRRADIPKRVTLNEAVELAKRFGSEQSASFVNGVLDRIARELGRE